MYSKRKLELRADFEAHATLRIPPEALNAILNK